MKNICVSFAKKKKNEKYELTKQAKAKRNYDSSFVRLCDSGGSHVRSGAVATTCAAGTRRSRVGLRTLETSSTRIDNESSFAHATHVGGKSEHDESAKKKCIN